MMVVIHLVHIFLYLVGTFVLIFSSMSLHPGHGSSLIICVGILTGYTDTLHKMLTQFSGNWYSCWPYILGIAGTFILVTMGAVLVTEGCRKIKLQYYGFKLASGAR
jgi:preprotein translocase subunit SecY